MSKANTFDSSKVEFRKRNSSHLRRVENMNLKQIALFHKRTILKIKLKNGECK